MYRQKIKYLRRPVLLLCFTLLSAAPSAATALHISTKMFDAVYFVFYYLCMCRNVYVGLSLDFGVPGPEASEMKNTNFFV